MSRMKRFIENGNGKNINKEIESNMLKSKLRSIQVQIEQNIDLGAMTAEVLGGLDYLKQIDESVYYKKLFASDFRKCLAGLALMVGVVQETLDKDILRLQTIHTAAATTKGISNGN